MREKHSSDFSNCRSRRGGVRLDQATIKMKESKQIEMFQEDLDKLVERYSSEFDLTLASMIGVLEVKIHEIIKNTIDQSEDEEEEVEEEDE